MKYAGIIKNDFTAGPGVCVTFFTQGCTHHCRGCHNPETWDFNGGREFSEETLEEILTAINANGVKRDFCIMGGEPMDEKNLPLTQYVIKKVKESYPQIKIYIWTGFTYEQLKNMPNPQISNILKMTDILIDGLYIEELRDVSLPMRGSSNQKIINLK